MERIDFYHLQDQSLDAVLPKLLEKAYETKKNIKLKVGNAERVEFVNSLLWTYSDTAFIPHGSAKDGNASLQPVFVSADDENPNGAEFLFLVDGALVDMETLKGFRRVFNIFDGTSAEALEQARSFWKSLKDEEGELNYWQFKSGAWVKSA